MTDKSRLYSVSELAKEVALTPQALRFYEEKGLLKPARSGGARVYTYRDRARLKLILKLRRLGFSLDDVFEYIELYGTGPSGAHQYRVGLQKVNTRLADLQRKRDEIDEIIAELHELYEEAERKLAEAEAEAIAKGEQPVSSAEG
jgi:DNA-binding transcriptional MerR regulator